MNKKKWIIFGIIATLLVLALAVLLLCRSCMNAVTGGNSETPGTTAGDILSTGTDTQDTTADPQDTTAGTQDPTTQTGTGETLDMSGGVMDLPDGDRGSSGGRSEPTQSSPTTAPTQSSPTTGKAEDPDTQTEPTQEQTEATAPADRELTWEEYEALSGAEQDAYAESLGVIAFTEWFNNALADYNARNPESTITGPFVDLGG